MKVRVVIADEAHARFYDLDRRTDLLPGRGALSVAVNLVDEAAHLHDRDFKSDRPGRFSSHASAPGTRRGASAHHAAGGDHSPREHEAQLFAQRIVARLQQDLAQGAPEHLILVAPPHFLGLLRQVLPAHLHHLVVQEIHKDLVHEPTEALQSHLAAMLLPPPQQ